jgi:hypothetical protein
MFKPHHTLYFGLTLFLASCGRPISPDWGYIEVLPTVYTDSRIKPKGPQAAPTPTVLQAPLVFQVTWDKHDAGFHYMFPLQKAIDAWNEQIGRTVFVLNSSGQALLPSDILVSTMTEPLVSPEKPYETAVGITWRAYNLEPTKIILRAPPSLNVVLGTIVHELGHAMGLEHSSNDLDIMYPSTNPSVQLPSGHDAELARQKVNPQP